MKSYFIDLKEYGADEDLPDNAELMLQYSLVRMGYHIFQSFLSTPTPNHVQQQLNELMEALTLCIPAHARVNLKMITDAKAVVTFLF